ncbi:MAG: 4'-phosphopantetheinyl transferase superfamily protein [gamma proteobacterium symbiont of Bathyaustriella thionipta]|nr:4'-phosphopantetheinyl transferase superfamily protein [gamma proteobacterium symbiont of Bathyaustriella thionipta]MCU7951052.1 4'-phosphopantetheinyl transferase superfamily protein [gamma proteobacterium symbiont of Bathyaustriella thionipta]MCU7954197.1 4'-phosphopantetheinyl transferase superfamily protein [gamma proteobacterium symbiont of Bathyaustriella thionipta]MCU7957559.1 4'-phosphopantetheinyl transferase superfamily protein [gamma proteobacterium symbiont of Bathyaustriella thio
MCYNTEPDYILSAEMIDIWLCQLSHQQEKENDFFAQLCDEEMRRAKRFKFAIHRSRFIASHGFTRTVLSHYLKTEPALINYRKGKQGKPYLVNINRSDVSHLQFNLSHTEDIAILVITQGAEIGVDIECNERKTDWQWIVQRFFTESEQKCLFALPEDQQKAAFFELWTRKEAYMKVLGTGLSLAPTEFSLTVPPEKPALIKHHSTTYPALEQVEFKTLKMPESFNHYCASLAVATTISKCRFYQFS